MRLKKILLSLFMIGLLVSCAEESVLELPKEQKGTIQIILTTGSVDTKVDTYGGTDDAMYAKATAEELQINKVYIALFGSDNKLVDGFYMTYGENDQPALGTGTSPDSNNLKREYTINERKINPGTYKILAIANSEINFDENSSSVRVYNQYSDFETAVEKNLTASSQLTATFNPANLVKVGKIDEVGIAADGNTSVRIPMEQLAAKVLLNFNVIIPGKTTTTIDDTWDFTKTNFTKDASLDEIKANFGDKVEIYDRTISNWNQDAANQVRQAVRQYYYNSSRYATDGNTSEIVVIHNKKESGTIQTSWTYQISEVVVNNIETESAILLTTVNSQSENLETLNLPVSNEGEVVLPFYTYEKAVDATNPLHVEVLGTLQKTASKNITTETRTDYAFYHNNNAQVRGWKDGNRFAYLEGTSTSSNKKDDTTTPYHNVGVDFNLIPKSGDGGNGSKTDGVIHGNLYDVSVSFSLSEVSEDIIDVKLEYDVLDWITGTTPPIIFN